MDSYITWGLYSSLYNNVPEEDFDRLARKASAKLDVYSHMRVREFEVSYDQDSATAFQRRVHEQIGLACCELANALRTQETAGLGTGVASVSNDGYSESYKITTAAEMEAQLLTIARSGLSGTGLMGAL